MGRWSRLVAAGFVGWVAAGPHLRWLDVGCGTGALTGAIVADADPAAVMGIDTSPGYVAVATRRLADPRVRFRVADAGEPAPAGSMDVAVSGLALNFVGDPDTVVAAMRDAVRPGGVVAAYVWDYRRMALLGHFWAAAAALDPAAAALDEAVRFSGWDADHLAARWHRAGLRDVDATAIEIACRMRGFDDYWRPFLGGQGPAAAYVRTLDDGGRAALRAAVRDRLPDGAAGPFMLPATAIAVRGTAPDGPHAHARSPAAS